MNLPQADLQVAHVIRITTGEHDLLAAIRMELHVTELLILLILFIGRFA